jgi:hypothetical protein
MNQLRSERLGEAFPLQGLLLRVHREGNIHRQHESEVDFGLRLGLNRSAQQSQEKG